MGALDARSFADSIMSDARALLSGVLNDAPELRARLAAFQADVEVTISSLEIETDPEMSRAIREDLERFLPARKAAVVSAARARYASDFHLLPPNQTQIESLESALTFAIRASVIVARAFFVPPLPKGK